MGQKKYGSRQGSRGLGERGRVLRKIEKKKKIRKKRIHNPDSEKR